MSIFGMFGRLHHSINTASQAGSAAASARRSESKAAGLAWEVRTLTDRLDRLSLICSAMWQLVRERTDLTEEDLMRRVQELDLADGVADGKKTKKVKRCPGCDRVMSPRHKRCLYCGRTVETADVFDRLS